MHTRENRNVALHTHRQCVKTARSLKLCLGREGHGQTDETRTSFTCVYIRTVKNRSALIQTNKCNRNSSNVPANQPCHVRILISTQASAFAYSLATNSHLLRIYRVSAINPDYFGQRIVPKPLHVFRFCCFPSDYQTMSFKMRGKTLYLDLWFLRYEHFGQGGYFVFRGSLLILGGKISRICNFCLGYKDEFLLVLK